MKDKFIALTRLALHGGMAYGILFAGINGFLGIMGVLYLITFIINSFAITGLFHLPSKTIKESREKIGPKWLEVIDNLVMFLIMVGFLWFGHYVVGVLAFLSLLASNIFVFFLKALEE